MHNNKHFTTFIIWFEWKAYKTGWNHNALQSALYRALPQWIKDVLHLAPKQTTYNGYKALVTQVRATNGNQPLISANSTNPAPHFPPGQGLSSANQPPGQCSLAQLNAADLHEALELLDANSNDLNNTPDSAKGQEALCTNKIRNRP
ncbi:hypothetical protein C0989_010012 [Termitomyces sp. Mn162]|nr:hypothetical protein C0989_010012 [Termitomyces sp. Mn162]